ncbi:MAG TPA: stage III sporulation protein AD [Symbiobacteriaceae bacterium]|nr:stage III sporulation protein AD [Symbiobacteriaceae bacterium]
MDIAKIVGIGLMAGILISLLRQHKPELAMQLSIATGAMIFLLMVSRVMHVVDVLQSLGDKAKVDAAHMGTVLKIIGIAYVADFGSQVLQDAGEKSIASKVEMAGKVIIMLLAIPIILAIVDSVLRLLA